MMADEWDVPPAAYIKCLSVGCESWIWGSRWTWKKPDCRKCGRPWASTFRHTGWLFPGDEEWLDPPPPSQRQAMGGKGKGKAMYGSQRWYNERQVRDDGSPSSPPLTKERQALRANLHWQELAKSALREHWPALPDKLREELDALMLEDDVTPTEPTAQEVTGAFKAATGKLKTLGIQKAALECRIDKAKASLDALYGKQQELDQEMADAKSKVQEISDQYWTVVLGMEKTEGPEVGEPTGQSEELLQSMLDNGDNLTEGQRGILRQLLGQTRADKRRRVAAPELKTPPDGSGNMEVENTDKSLEGLPKAAPSSPPRL